MKKSQVVWSLVATAAAMGTMTLPLAAQVRRVMRPQTRVTRPAAPPVLARTSQPLPSGPWEGTLQLSTSNGLRWSTTASAAYTTPCANGNIPSACGTNPTVPLVLRWAVDPNRVSSSYYQVNATQLNPTPGSDYSVGCDGPNNNTQATSYQVTARPNLKAGTTLVCQYTVTVTEHATTGPDVTRTTKPVTFSIQVTAGSTR